MIGRKGVRMWLALAAVLAATLSPAGQADLNCLWQIGQADSKTADLALGPTDYAKFSQDPLFVVGRSKARDGWPYVHPGPDDGWAGGRGHAFSVVFGVAELPTGAEGNVELRLLLYDTHSSRPPRLAASLNGEEAQSQQTSPGGGDASIMQGGPGKSSVVTFQFPLGFLKQGTNKLDIANVAGSWLLYDAVQFFAPGVRPGPPPPVYRIEALEDTVLARDEKGRPTQIVRVNVLALAEQGAQATLNARVETLGSSRTLSQQVDLTPGSHWYDLGIPPLSGWPAQVTVGLTVAGELRSTASLTAGPHRPWTVYLVPHSHVDVGYTDIQTKVLELQKQNIVRAMDFVEAHPEFAGDARFCWNVEVLWAVKDFLREADAAQRERFLRHVRQGSIGLDALFGNELTGLCSPEEMVRLLGYAGELVRGHGLQIDSAMITDVPGYSWGLIAAMSAAGVKYLDFGPNDSARIGSTRRTWEDRPFYWLPPDGGRPVLAWMAPRGYHRVMNLLRDERGARQLQAYLRGLEDKPHFPYDVVSLRMCTGDNGTPPFELCEFVQDWNARYKWPHLIIGRTHDAFRRLEERFGDRLPRFSGDFSPYWEDGAASSADETARTRRTAKALEAAEKIWSVARAAGGDAKPPLAALDAAWDNVLLYDEHTWGAHNSITEPDSPFVAEQWKIKRAFALDAERQAEQLWRGGLEELARQIATAGGQAIVVFNPSSWERTDLAQVEWPGGQSAAVLDSAGRAVPFVRSEDGQHLNFIARDVPPLGYRTYRLVRSKEGAEKPFDRAATADPVKGWLKSPFFEMEIDRRTASIKRVVAAGNLLRPAAQITRGGFNRFLYSHYADPSLAVGPHDAEVALAKAESPDGAALVMRSNAPGCRSLVQKIEVHGELPWIDITNTVDREDIREPEGVYFDFPLDGQKRARITFETAWAAVRLEDDLLAGACKNWFCAQHWVEVTGQRRTVVLTPIDAPLIEVGEIHANLRLEGDDGAWRRHHELPEVESLRLEPPRILSQVMNNYWFTNYRASQPGKTTFRYRIYHFAGQDRVQTVRCGIEAREPLRAVVVEGGEKGSLPDGAGSFVRVEPKNVMVTAVVPAARGGTLIRLHEIAGRGAAVRLWAARFGKQAERVDLWERPIAPLAPGRGHIDLRIRAHEIVTVRVF